MADLIKQYKKRKNMKIIKKKVIRTKNQFCINDKDYITLEEIEEIPTEDLIKLHINKKVQCYDKMSFEQLLKPTQKKLGYINSNSVEFYRIDLSFPIHILESEKKRFRIH